MSEILSFEQVLGYIASFVLLSGYAIKSDKKTKIILVFSSLFFAWHFFMLAAYAGAFVGLLNALRIVSSIKFYKSTKLMLGFIIAYLAIAIVVFNDVYDLLPIFSAVLGTYAMFKASGIKMRFFGLMGSCSWLIYAIIFGSIGGIITETSLIIIILLTMYRLHCDQKEVFDD